MGTRGTCFTGGASGSDFIFETESLKKGFKVVAYSFDNHSTKSKNRIILSQNQLKEGFKHIKIANNRLKRNLSNLEPYIKNLIARDWFQVKNSEAIFAVGIVNGENVMGGTGWAIGCAIDNKKPVYVFDQNYKSWFYYDYDDDRFQIYEGIPKLTDKFAGIGTRNINNEGIMAIVSLFKNLK
jgi:hypothetical protein